MLINIMEPSMRVLISGRTIAEIQVEVTLFGATPQIKTKSGNIATNWKTQILKVSGALKVKTTEVSNLRPDLVKHANLG